MREAKTSTASQFVDTGLPVTRHHSSVPVEVDVVGVWARNLVAVLSMTQLQQSFLDQGISTRRFAQG